MTHSSYHEYDPARLSALVSTRSKMEEVAEALEVGPLETRVRTEMVLSVRHANLTRGQGRRIDVDAGGGVTAWEPDGQICTTISKRGACYDLEALRTMCVQTLEGALDIHSPLAVLENYLSACGLSPERTGAQKLRVQMEGCIASGIIDHGGTFEAFLNDDLSLGGRVEVPMDSPGVVASMVMGFLSVTQSMEGKGWL